MSDFTSVAKSRARYYCKNSPVQFVYVELLRMEETGDMIVTLQFKNIAAQPLTAFTAHYRCKDANGHVVVEDNFTYDNLQVGEGCCFGSDDAVYVSAVPLSSVEVNLVSAQYGVGAPMKPLGQCPPVQLPVLKPMPKPVADRVNRVLMQKRIEWMPAPAGDGWQCGCGGFNYNIGKSAVQCGECGASKDALQTALRTAMDAGGVIPQSGQSERAFVPAQARVATFGDTTVASTSAQRASAVFHSINEQEDDYDDDFDDNTRVMATSARRPMRVAAAGGTVSIFSEDAIEFIMKIVPLITVGASAIYVLFALLLKMLFS